MAGEGNRADNSHSTHSDVIPTLKVLTCDLSISDF